MDFKKRLFSENKHIIGTNEFNLSESVFFAILCSGDNWH